MLVIFLHIITMVLSKVIIIDFVLKVFPLHCVWEQPKIKKYCRCCLAANCHPCISYNLSNLFSSNLATSNFKTSCAKERACASLEELLALEQNWKKITRCTNLRTHFRVFGVACFTNCLVTNKSIKAANKTQSCQQSVCDTFVRLFFLSEDWENNRSWKSCTYIWIF